MTTTFLLHAEPMLWGACFWYWLWTLLAFLLGALLAWLLGRRETEVVDNTQIIADRDRYHTAATKWEKDYNQLKYQLEESQKTQADLRDKLTRCNADKAVLEQEVTDVKASNAAGFAAGAAAGAAGNAALSGLAGAGNDRSTEEEDLTPGGGAKILPVAGLGDGAIGKGHRYDGLFTNDELIVIEGVGPKVNDALKAGGYNTWDDVAAAEAVNLKQALTNHGSNFGLADPTTWPEQARLASVGDWDELIKYQHFTDAGRENVGDFESDSKFEKLAEARLKRRGTVKAATPGSVYDGLFSTDNLLVIEGIGPKVGQVLKEAGYQEWSQLAAAEPEELRRVLTAAGSNYSLSDPTSWPHQAGLAAAGDWDELIRYQKFTDGGRETVGDFESDSKFEKLATKELGFSSSNPNDLKVVEGIGPKIEGLLKDAGINTWQELATADVTRLQSILDAAGSRYKMATPRTWPEQATLAAAGDWKALKDLQDRLQGGV